MGWTSDFLEIMETLSANNYNDTRYSEIMGWTSGFLEIMETSSANTRYKPYKL